MALLILRESNDAARYAGRHPSPQRHPSFATPHLGHITMPHPSSTLAAPGQHLARRSGNTPTPYRVHPAPYRAHPPSRIGPATLQHCFGTSPQESRNKKSAQIATFLRLGIVAWRQNAIRSPKTQQKRPFSGLEEQRRVRNRKKVAKIPSFLFLQWVQPPQQGKSREKRAEYHDRRPKIRNKKAPAMRAPSEKSIWPESPESTLPWHRTARNKHRAQPSAYRRSLLRPVPHGCTEAR